MKIKKFIVNPFQMNCYIYYNEASGEGIIIDPGAYDKYEEDEIIGFIETKNIKIVYSLNTHGHIDHILGNKFAKEYFNVPHLIHEDDLFLLKDAKKLGMLFGISIDDVPPPDNFITENMILSLGENEINFIHTPGHSPGGVCIVDHMNKIIFSGDTLFRESIGRTDLAGGDINILLDSIKNKLFLKCDDDYELYPGHMQESTIGKEKIFNPFLQ